MIVLLLLAPVALYVGNHACAACHSEIFKAYSQTPMAQSSGAVTGGLTPGSFLQGDAKTTYRIDSAGAVTVVTPMQSVERKLDYFIGSGAAGRSYLYTRNGFLFQAPVTWYAQQARWDASPGYEQDRVSRWNRPIAADCLNCHSSQVRSAAGFANRYADPPFAQAGIGCERCHGPGSQHISGQGSMVNPTKLDAARRDSICAQCHMSGEARVARVGMRFEEYRPGALLSDYAAYFVFQGAPPLKATSYVEKLAASRCKAVSGDRLWCGTCHDPHRTPAAGERVAWYRSRCLGCHQQAQCQRTSAQGPVARRHTTKELARPSGGALDPGPVVREFPNSDCIACHMPRGRVVGVGHGVLTDHSIPRLASSLQPEPRDVWKLQPFSQADAGPRELGLAYAEVSTRTGDARQIREAIRLLSGASQDADAELQLADLYQRSGEARQAVSLYRSVLNKQPGSLVALVNLGNAYAAANQMEDAIKLWQEALRRQPCQTEAAQNLRTVYQARKQTGQLLELTRNQAGCVIE